MSSPGLLVSPQWASLRLCLVRTPVTLDLGPALWHRLTFITFRRPGLQPQSQSGSGPQHKFRGSGGHGLAQSKGDEGSAVPPVPGSRCPPDALPRPGSSRRVGTLADVCSWSFSLSLFLMK